MSTATEDRYTKELMMIFEISEQDLEANRRGDLTDEQKKRMQNIQLQGALFTAGVFWLMSAVFYGILFFSWSDINRHLSRGDTMLQAILIGAFIVLPTVCLIVGLYFIYKWWSNKNDVEVSSIEGDIRLKHTRIRRNEFYEMFVGSEKFPLSPDMFNILKEGQAHRIYYIDSTKHILSIEPLTG